MDLATDTVTEIILRLRARDVKEGATDPDSGSNPTDDGATDVLVSGTDEAGESEIVGLIEGLNVDERAELLALLFVGRGDMEPEEWDGAVRFAREREAAGEGVRQELLSIPDAADLLAEGLERRGIPQDVAQA